MLYKCYSVCYKIFKITLVYCPMKHLKRYTLSVIALLLCSGLPAHADYTLDYVGELIEYRTNYEDTFVHLARDYELGYVEMRSANPDVDPWLPGRDTKLILPTQHLLPNAPRQGIVINLPEMRLYAYVNGNKAPVTFPIGIGREGLGTPVGSTKVVRKKEGPSWRPTERMRKEKPELPVVVEPGPENPLGTHAIYLGWPTYAIHGTNRPFGIGRRVSSGCIRMYPRNIIALYDYIPVGTPVTVVDQPVKVGWIGDELFLEATVPVDLAIEMEETGRVKAPQLTEDELAMITKAAGEHKDRLNWPLIRKAVSERAGYPVAIARRPSITTGASLENSGTEQTTQSHGNVSTGFYAREDRRELTNFVADNVQQNIGTHVDLGNAASQKDKISPPRQYKPSPHGRSDLQILRAAHVEESSEETSQDLKSGFVTQEHEPEATSPEATKVADQKSPATKTSDVPMIYNQ